MRFDWAFHSGPRVFNVISDSDAGDGDYQTDGKASVFCIHLGIPLETVYTALVSCDLLRT